jgi:hypothetical protein
LLGYIVVVLVALGVGAGVYRFSMDFGAARDASVVEEWKDDPAPSAGGFGAGGEVPASPSGRSYIPIAPGRPSWQSRLGGVMGLVVAVSLAAAALALGLYEIGSLIARLLSNAAKSG